MEGRDSPVTKFPHFSSNTPPQKYSKASVGDLLNISTAAEPKLRAFQVLLEVGSSSLNKTNKIYNNIYTHVSIFLSW